MGFSGTNVPELADVFWIAALGNGLGQAGYRKRGRTSVHYWTVLGNDLKYSLDRGRTFRELAVASDDPADSGRAENGGS